MSTILQYERTPLLYLLEECRLAINDTNSVSLRGSLILAEDNEVLLDNAVLTIGPGESPMPTFVFVGEVTKDYVYRSMTINVDALGAAIKYQFLADRISRIDCKFNYS